MSSIEEIIFSPLTKYINIKPDTEKALARLSITNIRDLLFHLPHSYLNNKLFPEKSEIKHGDRVILEAEIIEIQVPSRKTAPIRIYTDTKAGPLVLVFFNKIPTFIYNKLRVGNKCIIEGVVEFIDFYFQIKHPDFIFNKPQNHNIEPVYPLTYALNNKQLASYITTAFNLLEYSHNDYIAPIIDALKKIHYPKNQNEISNIEESRKILAKYELLANQINLASIREKIQKARGRSFTKASLFQENILNKLGFTLTSSQAQALKEIEHDQLDDTRMVRMLQGDVGSGKTLVALLTMLNVMDSNLQSVLMAPTDLLAVQHYEFFLKALGHDAPVALLTSKNKPKDILQKLENGEILILIGTHAVFQEKVNFKDLAFIIIDEQHKFGVEQRLDLINKANMPDLLVMTATPIPRSLTLTLFGDMENSKLTDKPKGRLPIITNTIPKTRINEVVEAMQRKIEIGEKIYWICPLIEKNEESHLIDVETRFEDLAQIFPGKIDLVHGRMNNAEKDDSMRKFKDGATKILIATTVIEVGIDVPDATLIIIENAEQFGLASLHQLRGRVGRSNLQSHAILLYDNTRASKMARQRLAIMRSSEDGFYIAEQDLLLRGGGEILGTKQSGMQNFIFADLMIDGDILLEANKIARDQSQFPDLLLRLFDKQRVMQEKILE